MRWVVFKAFILALATGFSAPAAWACSCTPELSPRGAFANSPAVFMGVVRAVDGPYPLPVGHGLYVESARNFRFEVLNAWKGVDRKSVVVRTGSGGGDCGFDFVLGEVYLVYASRSKTGDTLTTNICTRTRRFIDAAVDSAELGNPAVDKSGGEHWRSFRPSSRCPIHRERSITSQHMNIVFGLPRHLDLEYRDVQELRFPYAGLQIDRPPQATRDEAGRLFRGLNRALVCSDCRGQALEWCRRHGGRSANDGE